MCGLSNNQLFDDSHKKTIDEDNKTYVYDKEGDRIEISPLIFLTSIGISFINVQTAQYFWLAILPANIIIYMKHIPHLRRL